MTDTAESIAKMATMEANMTHLTSQMGKMIGYLETGSQRGTEQTASLAVLTDNVKDLKAEFMDYRKDCSIERDTHSTKILVIETWQKNRDTNDERDNKRQNRITAGIATGLSLLIGAFTILVEWAKK